MSEKTELDDNLKVKATAAACELIDSLREEHGELMFHQSGGCCDGSSPMCFLKGEFRIGNSDEFLGSIHGCEFYMAKDQYKFFKHTQLIVDVVEGRGSSFSIEIPRGFRFVIKSKLFCGVDGVVGAASLSASKR